MLAAHRFRYLLYGGSRGPGKSYILRWGLVWRLVDWFRRLGLRGVRVGLFCEDYPTLRDRQISKIKDEFPLWLGELKSTSADGLGFHLWPEYGSGIVLLRNLDEPARYVGAEFAGIAVDELTRNPIETFNILRGSLRWPDLAETFFWAATMPTGIGLAWVRALWIERKFPPEMQALAPQFGFVKAYPQDNSHLTQAYWDDLHSQPPHIQRAWIEGDWYVPVGIMFDELDPQLHQGAAGPPPRGWSLEIAADWGYDHFAAAGWFATDDGQRHGVPHSVMYREHVVRQTHPALFASQVVSLSEGEDIRKFTLDSAAWARGQDGGVSPAEQMQPTLEAAGITLIPSVKGKGSRAHGAQLLHTYLYHGWPGGPLLTFSKACGETWKQLTSLIRAEPPQDTEDIAKGQVDDCYAMLRYFLQGRPEPALGITSAVTEVERADARPPVGELLVRAYQKRLLAVRDVPRKAKKRSGPPWQKR